MARLFFRLALALWCGALGALLVSLLLDGQPGDAARGAALYYGGRLACTACHLSEYSAPLLTGIAKQVRDVRLASIGNGDESVAEYLAESIIDPNRYLVPGYPADNMPHYAIAPVFGLSLQDLKDLVAYLMTS